MALVRARLVVVVHRAVPFEGLDIPAHRGGLDPVDAVTDPAVAEVLAYVYRLKAGNR